MEELAIPKNHSQRMYKFGYDTAKQEMIKDFLNWLINDLGRCEICYTHNKAILSKIRELKSREIK